MIPVPLFPTQVPARVADASAKLSLYDGERFDISLTRCCDNDESLTLLVLFRRLEPAAFSEELAYARRRTGVVTPQTIRGKPGYFLDDGRSWIYMWPEQGCTYLAASRYGFAESLTKDELLAMAESASPLALTARTAGTLGPCVPPTYLPSTCVDQVYRPKTVVVACGDGNLILTRMRWSGWGNKTASGRGTAKLNQCRPDCARGRFRKA